MVARWVWWFRWHGPLMEALNLASDDGLLNLTDDGLLSLADYWVVIFLV